MEFKLLLMKRDVLFKFNAYHLNVKVGDDEGMALKQFPDDTIYLLTCKAKKCKKIRSK